MYVKKALHSETLQSSTKLYYCFPIVIQNQLDEFWFPEDHGVIARVVWLESYFPKWSCELSNKILFHNYGKKNQYQKLFDTGWNVKT